MTMYAQPFAFAGTSTGIMWDGESRHHLRLSVKRRARSWSFTSSICVGRALMATLALGWA